MTGMETVDIFKALANDTRLTILMWLKEPEKYFPPQGIHIPEGDSLITASVSGRSATKRGFLSPPCRITSTSLRLAALESRRYGKWTYYRRNEENIRKLADYTRPDLIQNRELEQKLPAF